ncbi:MAG TPA: lysophospholipid acyltransferase family protein [Pyrinomonadaceae bacterium]|nr:lysophospholipid acyltransferase family protein [Pyrinomonadaceae bacterium]
MSESSQSIAPRRQAQEPQPEPFVLPLWVINVIRVPLYLISRLFWRLSYRGLENIPETGGVLIASNHQTYLDPIWMSLPIRRQIRYLAWSESFHWPVIGKVITALGAWPIQIEKADKTMLRRTLNWLRSGGAMIIFPEGGRCVSDGKFQRFKPGAVRMALEANIPILPITIRGGHRVWPRGWSFPHIHKVELVFHPLQHVTVQEGEDARQAARRETDKLAETIGSAL